MSLDKSRNTSIDILKAIGLFFVIIGHHRHIFYNYIYSFHMPLFFFISGFLYKRQNYASIYAIAVTKFKRLLVPYFSLSALLYLIWVGFSLIKPSVLKDTSYIKGLLGILYAQGQLTYMGWGVHMWFLPCLFLVFILVYLLSKLKVITSYIILLIMVLLSHVWTRCYEYNLPWSFNLVPSMTVFFIIGKICFKNYLTIKRIKPTIILFLSTMLLFLNILFFVVNTGRIDVYMGIFQTETFFYISAISGVLFFFLIVRFIPNSKMFYMLSVNSLAIYTLHMRAFTLISPGLSRVDVLHQGTLIFAFTSTALQIIVLIPAVYIINKYIPFIVGRKKSLSKAETVIV